MPGETFLFLLIYVIILTMINNVKPDRQSIEKPLADLAGLKEKIEQASEQDREKIIEQARKTVVNEIAQTESMAPPALGPAANVMAPLAKRQKQIENVLAAGLEEVYLSLAPEKRKEFKRVGEETAGKINKILAKAKVNIGRIVRLIRKWLSLIPGVNRYFLDQEAKIKADEIIKMRSENK